MINYDFSFDTEFGMYNDSIILSDDHTFTDQEIEDMKQQRLSNWLSIFNSPVSTDG